MSDALTALVRGLINSVIAPRGTPPPLDSSRQDKPVTKYVAAVAGGCGKRSASSLRRSIIFPLAAMQKIWPLPNICSREHLRLLSALLFTDQRHHHALNF